ERVDFGEAHEDKFFVIAHIEKDRDTKIEWRKIEGTRPFIERRIILDSNENVNETLISALPNPKQLEGAIIKLTVEYPRDWESLIDDAAIRRYTENAFEFHLIKRPQIYDEKRVRVPAGQTASSLSPLDLLDQYWRAA